jgi:ADP-ribose pyrophosphatase YjhB (NUDIX family)
LESLKETAQRETLEETLITIVRKKIKFVLTKETFGYHIHLNKVPYFECNVDGKPNSNDRKRLIGLYIVHVNEKKLKFKKKDGKEVKVTEYFFPLLKLNYNIKLFVDIPF